MLRHRHLAALVIAAIAAGVAAQRADATLSSGNKATPTCWAGLDGPVHIGSNIIAISTWQCSPGIQQSIQSYTTLKSPMGTTYGHSKTCYNTTFCQDTVTVGYYEDANYGNTWTVKAEYAYVVDNQGASSYHFGGSQSQAVQP